MTSFIPLQPKQLPDSEVVSPEAQFWKSFVNPVLVKEFNSISTIQFSPIAPHDFAVTASTRVQIYSSRTQSVVKSIARFNDTAYSGTFRSDGKLLVAGDNLGVIQIFDVNSRVILRTMKEHRGPVQITKFHNDNTKLLSGSDDKLVKVWDIPSQSSTHTFVGHSDYVRSGSVFPDNPNLFVSGSYDGTVKLWDSRNPSQAGCCLTIDHGAPVEDVLVYPVGSLVAVAGGPQVSIYDLVGGKRLQQLENFQKTVTTLTLDGTRSRLLAGSLDHHVKVYDIASYTMQHSIKYPSPILSVAISPTNDTLAVGMVSGALSIRRRLSPAALAKKESFSIGNKFTSKRTIAGLPYLASNHFSNPSPDKIAFHDKCMAEFKYREALDTLLAYGPKHDSLAIEGLREIIRRGSLDVALSGRDDQNLLPLLKFLSRNVRGSNSALVIKITECVLDLYDRVISHSPALNQVLSQLRDCISYELKSQQKLVALSGIAEMIRTKSIIR